MYLKIKGNVFFIRIKNVLMNDKAYMWYMYKERSHYSTHILETKGVLSANQTYLKYPDLCNPIWL